MNSDVREASHPAAVGEQAWGEVAALNIGRQLMSWRLYTEITCSSDQEIMSCQSSNLHLSIINRHSTLPTPTKLAPPLWLGERPLARPSSYLWTPFELCLQIGIPEARMYPKHVCKASRTHEHP